MNQLSKRLYKSNSSMYVRT